MSLADHICSTRTNADLGQLTHWLVAQRHVTNLQQRQRQQQKDLQAVVLMKNSSVCQLSTSTLPARSPVHVMYTLCSIKTWYSSLFLFDCKSV